MMSEEYWESPSMIQQRYATVEAWKTPYVGDYHRAFADAIQVAKRQANGAPHKNIIPIIQSSGTGKSRLAHEVAGTVVTLPVNIRPPADRSAYPPTDMEAFTFLKEGSYTWTGVKVRQLAFFLAMFDVASEHLAVLSPGTTYDDETQLAKNWREYLESNNSQTRRHFHRRVVEVAHALLADVREYYPNESEEKLALDKMKAKAHSAGPRKLVEVIASRLAGGFKNPDVVVFVYIDEVHDYSTIQCDDIRSKNLYDALLDAWNDLGPAHPIFLATIATSPSIVRPLNRPLRYQAPYTELVFDCFPDECPLFVPGTMTLKDVAELAFMVKFGRPLFWTRWKAAEDLHLGMVFENIRDFALAKLTLCDPWYFDRVQKSQSMSHSQAALFAPICTRALVEFDAACPQVRDLEEDMVSGHMRILFSVPEHNSYIYSGTPSEPILAEAAAMLMNEHNYNAVELLADDAESSFLKLGPDLITRLLLMSAYDRAVCKRIPERDNRIYSTAVPLIDFLDELFASQWHDTLRSCTAQGSSSTLYDSFSGAFVRFTHFVKYNGDSLLDSLASLAGVARGFACYLSPPQAGIHIAIPVVMHDDKLSEELMSFLLIDVKSKDEVAYRPGQDALAEIFHHTSHSHPIIHLLVQFDPGTSTPAKIAMDEESFPHPCYRLTAYGCSPSVYKVINDANHAAYTTLRRPQTLASEHIRQDERNVAIVQGFKGEWERGSACYSWIDIPTLNTALDEPHEEVEGLFAI